MLLSLRDEKNCYIVFDEIFTLISKQFKQNPEVAKEYFEFKKGDIKDADTVARLQKMVDEGASRKNAQTLVDSYWDRGFSKNKAYDEAKKIDDTQDRKQTEDRINEVYGRRDAARRDALEKTTIRYFNMVEKGQDPRKDPVWGSLEPAQRNAVLGYIDRLSKGEEAVTDPQKYRDLREMAGNEDTRNKFLKMNLQNEINNLSKDQFNEITKLQKDMREGKFDLGSDIASKTTIFNKTMKEAGISDKRANELYVKMSQIDNNRTKATGKHSSATEFQQELDYLIKTEIGDKPFDLSLPASTLAIPILGTSLYFASKPINYAANLFKDKKNIIDLSEEEIENMTYEQMPISDITVTERGLMAEGLPSDKKSVLEAYKAQLREIHGYKD